MIVKYKTVGREELQGCHAEVDMRTGVVSINADVWDIYDDFEKNFIIAHEMGHYNLDTDDETAADKYALSYVFGTAPRSLKRSIQALYRIGVLDSDRVLKLYQYALQMDANAGNQQAAIELQSVENDYNEEFNQTSTTNQNQEKMKRNYIYCRADGEETVETETKKRGHGMNGVNIGGYYFSFANILLLVIAILVFMIYKKN